MPVSPICVKLMCTTKVGKFGQYLVDAADAPIFTRRRLQPGYNQKARYLPILKKCVSHKYSIISKL